MSLNDTPSANRIHIGFFGRRNAGKSSLVNAVTAQDLAVVSDRPGTTTDPVQKAMELLPLGPVVMTDTPGFDDDEQELGSKRVLRTKRVLNKTDIAVLVVDGTKGMDDFDTELLALFREKEIPHLVVFNKATGCHRAPRASCASARRPERASRRSKTASARSRQKKTAGSCWQTSSARTRWSYWSRRLTNLRRRGA